MSIKLTIRRKGAAPNAPPLSEQAFDAPIIAIGSDMAADVRLDGAAVAPEHAIILNEDGQMLFINRAPGTVFNGQPLRREARRTLAPGDSFQVGTYLVTVDFRNDALLAPDARPAEAATGSDSPPRDAEREPTTIEPNAQAGSFAAILDSLRTEEDSFYFELVSAARGRRRIPIEGAEMLVGWDESGRELSCDANTIRAPRALVRKDWSGVVVYPHGPGTVEVNGEPVESVRRLRNGDRLTLLPTAVASDPQENYFVFHEPATLVVLDSLLPQQLPPPVAPAASIVPVESSLEPVAVAAAPAQEQPPALRSKPRAPARKYFGYFTFGEVVIMITGTLLAASIIFLILEFL